MAKTPYTKPSLTDKQHLDLLVNRGLAISNPATVLHFLKFIGYYRLSGYALPFQMKEKILSDSKHTFRPGVTFEMILDLYVFDRELRLIVMDAVERIEIAARACISNTMCQLYGSHWFIDKTRFHPKFLYDDFVAQLEKELKLNARGDLPNTKDVFLRHYYEKYDHPKFPPCWMVLEILTIGKWSILYKNIRPSQDQEAIARHFNLHHNIFESWLHSLTYLRNLCAHHSRLWNRWFAIPPRVMNKYQEHMVPNHTFYAQASMLHILLKSIAPESRWPTRLHELMKKHPTIPIASMGFKENWQTNPFWTSAA